MVLIKVWFSILIIVLPSINLIAQETDSIIKESDTILIHLGDTDSLDAKLPFSLSELDKDSIAEIEEYNLIPESEKSDITVNLLKPPITDSPQATLKHFVNTMNRSYRLVNKGYKLSQEQSGWVLSDEVKVLENQAEYLFERSIYCLDLSDIPESIRDNIGFDLAFRLKEILDRIDLPEWAEVPNYVEVKDDLENNKYPSLLKWTIPNTDIVISRIQDGERAGQYLFSAKTIAQIPEFYEKIEHLSYVDNKFVSRDFYKFYISTPGHLMPPKWTSLLPMWSFKMYFSHTVYQWIGFIFTFLLAVLITKIFYWFLIVKFKDSAHGLKTWTKVLYLFLMVLLIDGLHYLNQLINLTEQVFILYTMLFEIMGWVITAMLVFKLIQAISTTILTSGRIGKVGVETTYTRAILSLIAIISAVAVLIYGLSRIGVSLLPLLTGLGIGGLAIALAARSTIENIIASFTLFAEKLYKVGDRINILGYDGRIEGIGIRSTQIRTLQGPLVSIPNEKMVTVEIENIEERPYIRREFDVTITYDTSLGKIKEAINILNDILAVKETSEGEIHPNVSINDPEFPPKVHFEKFNADSLNIYVSYWFSPPDRWKALEHAEWINLQIFEQFNKAGIDFAFPTQTIQMSDS